jgi:hypothetical protein
MKHLKTFEELKPSTYFSAADKLKSKGHSSRADVLYDYGKSKIKTSPLEFTIYFEPSKTVDTTMWRDILLPPNKKETVGFVATREEANQMVKLCKEMGILGVSANDLYKEGVDKDPKMQSFKAEFIPKFKKFRNNEKPDFSKSPIHPQSAEVKAGLMEIHIVVKLETKSDFAPGSKSMLKATIPNFKYNPIPEKKPEKKGLLKRAKDWFNDTRS